MKRIKPSERIEQISQEMIKNNEGPGHLGAQAIIKYLDEQHDKYIKAGGEDQFC